MNTVPNTRPKTMELDRAAFNHSREACLELHALKSRADAVDGLVEALSECLLNTGGGWISASVIERATKVRDAAVANFAIDTNNWNSENIAELSQGDGTYYVTQEAAFAPGISGEWPNVIPHPTNRNGRLVKRQWRSCELPAPQANFPAATQSAPFTGFQVEDSCDEYD